VVIVNYGQWRETTALARQVVASPAGRLGDIEVVVVDNHSTYHPLLGRLRRWPGVSLRRWRRNRGFARAANEGCRLSQGCWMLLLNPDVSLEGAFLEEVLELADRLPTEDPRTGIVGFHLRNSDGTLQLSAGNFPTLLSTLLRLPLPRARRKCSLPPTDQPRPVPWVTGCCLLLRRECFQQLKGFDNDFFLYYEDVDLCRRARAEGWGVRYEPAAGVMHQRPLHGREVSAAVRLFTRHALLTYGSKHWPGWQAWLLAKLVQLEAWVQRCRTAWLGDHRAAAHFAELGCLSGEIARGRHRAARRRLEGVVRAAELQNVS
jgi:GT2 family glycosyltransferase